MAEEWERYLLQEAAVVFKYLIKIGVHKEDAEDVVQDAIITTIENIAQIDEKKLRAWLFKVALNRYYNLYKSEKKQASLTDEDLQQIKSAINVDEELISKELAGDLRAVIHTLPSTFQELLIMKYFMELSYKEMALIMEQSEDFIRTYLYRARKALRKKWEGL